MSIRFIELIVLYCLVKINGERTIYSIYHLLKGKKSSQTIQDAHLFQLTSFFQTFQDLSRSEFTEIVMVLEKKNFLYKKVDTYFLPTKEGKEEGNVLEKKFPFLHSLHGWNFQHADLFWQRLTLLVQVVSHLSHREAHYIPIQNNKDVQAWLKQYLQTSTISRNEMSIKLYEELHKCFKGQMAIDPSILVFRFSGYKKIGLTKQQVCDLLQLESSLYHYQCYSLLHAIMDQVQRDPNRFPLLSSIIPVQSVGPLTESAKKTFALLNKGFSIEQIAAYRKLRVSTIQDHIVEIALQQENFDLSPYMGEERIAEIRKAARKSITKQLKHIRELVPEASYFEIRLVLATTGDVHHAP